MDFNINFKSFISYFFKPLGLSLVLSFLLIVNSLALEKEDDVFFIDDIDIYAESDNLENAKNVAFNSGTKQAFSKLMERMLPKEQWWKVGDIANQKAHLALQESYVIEERMTSHSYRAKVAFYFNAKEVKKILQRAGTFYFDQYSAPHVLIPVLRKGNNFIIWQDNAWNTAWDDRPSRIGLFSFVYLKDDINDIDLLNKSDSLLETRLYKFAPVIERYAAEGIVLIIGDKIENELHLTIRIASRAKDTIRVFSYIQEEGVSNEDFYKNVASDALDKIDSLYKGYDLLSIDKLFETEFVYNFDNKKNWRDLKIQLSKISEIRKLEVLEQNEVSARFKIIYNSDPTIMGKILYNNNVSITQENGKLTLSFENSPS